MADYPISNVPRRIVYTGSAGVGPYAFPFEVLLNTDINVYKNDVLLTLTTNYTVSISPTLGTGTVTLVVAATGADRITIVGSRAVQRSTDFTTGGDFFANTINNELDSQTILTQQVAETAERSIKAPVTDPTNINMTLPVNTARAGKILSFDNNGNPIAGEPVGNWRGDWAAGVTYQNRDLVKDTTNDNIYIIKVAHTSIGSLPIDTNADSAKWDLFIDAEAAGDARIGAEAAEDAALVSANNAASSASAAATSATNAATSATSSGASASSASGSASTATTQATNAGNSASSASTSATNAASSASAASTSATNASNSATSASTSASTATTQATNASNSATAASTSATNASNSATAAATSATNASNSASSASTSATNAASSATSAANSLDAFDDRYLGSKSSAPSLDNDGNALLTGALYWNSTSNTLFVWAGSSWNQAAFDVSDTGVASFNTRIGAVTLSSTDVTNALTFTPQAYDADTTKNDVANTFTANQVISVTDNTNAALRITQLGTGAAIRVEDETNPDSTPFIVTGDGRVGIGNPSPTNILDITAQEPFVKIYTPSSGLAAFYQATTPLGNIWIGKDRDGSAGLFGSAGEYVIAGTGNYPMDFWTNSVKRMTITGDGNVNFAGTGQRITGDFSTSTIASRLMFQTSVTNGNTVVTAIPNGTGSISQFQANNNSNSTNASTCAILATSVDARLIAGTTGTGTYLPLGFYTNNALTMQIETNGNVNFAGTGQRIQGDFSNATLVNRTAIQTNVINGNSIVTIIPNGTSTNSQLQVNNNSDFANGSAGQLSAGSTTVNLNSFGFGTASSLPIAFNINSIERMRLDTNGNLLFNSGYGSAATAYGCRAWVNFNGTANTNLTGTYSQTGTTVTVSITSHGYVTGQSAFLDFTSGTAVDGAYTVTVTDANTFTVQQALRTTSGNVTNVLSTIRASGNVSSVSDNGTGDYTVNFTNAMPDTNYVICGLGGSAASGQLKSITKRGTLTTSACGINTYDGSLTVEADLEYVDVAIFR